jgi:4-amino-4-deoxy-L-arabinose transferase-like glycosyltransferase
VSKRAQHWALLIAIILLGAWLRWTALAADERLHPDEALFATFARGAALSGDWLLLGALDKPPVSIYAVALSMLPFVTPLQNGLPDLDPRIGEVAARLPGALASSLLLPLTYVLARRLYGRGDVAWLSMLLVAISPFAVAFGAVAFTDALMLLFVTAALCAVAYRRWTWAGVGLALGLATKQQAVFALPLVIMLGWALGGLRWRSLLMLILPQVVAIAALLGWDALRGQPTGSFALALANNDPARLIRSDELVPRLLVWLRHLNAFLLPASVVALPTALIVAVGRVLRRDRSRAALIDILLLLYFVAYLLLHWLVALNTYDRYLLPILIPTLLLCARGMLALWAWLRLRLPIAELRVAGIVFALAILGSAREGALGRLDVGGDRGEHQGIETVAAYLNSQSLGAIIYDHWIGWELDYYLGEWTDKRRVYYPTPQALVVDALLQPDRAPRYFVAPRSRALRPWLEALTAAGFAPVLAEEWAGFVVYRLTPPPN